MEPHQRGRADAAAAALSAQLTVAGDTVYKLHRADTDPRALTARLRIADVVDALLSPLSVRPEPVGQRWRTSWPLVETVAAEPSRVPWRQAGALLAELHREPLPARPPVHGWPQRLRRTVRRLAAAPGSIRRAAAALPDVVWRAGSPGRPRALVHGDWHLGQLGRTLSDSRWVLIDVDDLGVGDPAWDLARPAGFWAAGLIPDPDWESFQAGYRDARGPALPPGDPWPVLEPFARAAVVHAAATGAARHEDDGTQDALLAACERMG